ncbi:hypothetical protein RHMOL_Rhmol03G0210800 [Rhododendron molle]|uniref:Uncharacterized protein n=1 Tax=Rhododendron molle TaxID=49168 RepID=A0ACC0PH27_RHOML|nr:hypothetical protein RHMOL_Rhmol03G0210800 [Rhododendron molle]
MISMTSLCGGVHTILTNKRKGNVHPLLKRMNKIALPLHQTLGGSKLALYSVLLLITILNSSPPPPATTTIIGFASGDQPFAKIDAPPTTTDDKPTAKSISGKKKRENSNGITGKKGRMAMAQLAQHMESFNTGDAIEYLKELLQRINDLYNKLRATPPDLVAKKSAMI